MWKIKKFVKHLLLLEVEPPRKLGIVRWAYELVEVTCKGYDLTSKRKKDKLLDKGKCGLKKLY